ncbi:hypothetical protein V8E36_004798, partial [Tilletia maclaganii]
REQHINFFATTTVIRAINTLSIHFHHTDTQHSPPLVHDPLLSIPACHRQTSLATSAPSTPSRPAFERDSKLAQICQSGSGSRQQQQQQQQQQRQRQQQQRRSARVRSVRSRRLGRQSHRLRRARAGEEDGQEHWTDERATNILVRHATAALRGTPKDTRSARTSGCSIRHFNFLCADAA